MTENARKWRGSISEPAGELGRINSIQTRWRSTVTCDPCKLENGPLFAPGKLCLCIIPAFS
jgi:hypothetical protein